MAAPTLTGPMHDVLALLLQAWQDDRDEVDGWLIMKTLHRSGPTVYRALDRLEDAGWNDASWEVLEGNEIRARQRFIGSLRPESKRRARTLRPPPNRGYADCAPTSVVPRDARRDRGRDPARAGGQRIHRCVAVGCSQDCPLGRAIPVCRRPRAVPDSRGGAPTLIDERPGKLFKLGTACRFATAALFYRARKAFWGEGSEPSQGVLDGMPSNMVMPYLFPTEQFRASGGGTR